MDDLTEFLAMGGYAKFVWPAYGLVVIVLGGLALAAIRRLRRSAVDLALLEAARPRQRGPATGMAAGEAS